MIQHLKEAHFLTTIQNKFLYPAVINSCTQSLDLPMKKNNIPDSKLRNINVG